MTETSNTQDVLVFPMSYGQEQLWYLNEIDPDSSAYNIPFAFHIRGMLCKDSLARAIQEVVNRHEALRTNFANVRDVPSQIVHASRPVEMVVEDLRESGLEEARIVARRRAHEEALRAFDLRHDPLIRARLLCIGEEEHFLLLGFHHITVDHLAILRIKHEIESFYASYRKGVTPPQPKEELQFADFAVWQRENVVGDKLAKKLEYWVERFEGRQGILALPTDRPRPAMQTFVGDELSFTFSEGLTTSIKEFCRTQGISQFVALLAVTKILLYRYTQQSDITVGCPFANRGREELEDVVGLFMNLLPIASDIDGSATFKDLVSQVRKTVTSAQAHQDTPFEPIVQAASRDRDPAYNPMLQVWFTVQDPPMSLQLEGLEVKSLNIHNGGAKLDLSFWLWEDKGQISGLLEYNSDLFDRETVECMSENLKRLVQAVVEDASQPIDELPVLTDAQLSRMDAWNATKRDVPRTCTHDLISERARLSPEAIACESSSQRMTYAELDAAAERYAFTLRAQGVQPGSIVGLFTSRSPTMVACMLGIWKNGCAYLPLDPDYPDERLRFMVDDSAAAIVMTEGDLSSRAGKFGKPLLPVDDMEAPDEHTQLDTMVSADDLAYVIYTSGSTGRPKGVKVPHAALTNLLNSMADETGFTSKESIAAITTIAFDISILEIFLPLIAGGRVWIVSRDVSSDPSRLAEELATCGATVVQATPSGWRVLVQSGWQGSSDLRILCGGEPLPEDLAKELLKRCGELWNVFGPTETTIWSTCKRIRADDAEITIGKPIGNTVVHVLDANGQRTPLGVPGELYIGGAGVTSGYVNRAELTNERFVPDPFRADGGLVYRTGDRVKWNHSGELVHLGRLDRQIKLRAFRVELGEIENILCELPDVENAAVTVWDAGAGDQRLVAYVVPSKRKLNSVGLRKGIRQRLPDYMIPQHFVEIEQLPMTANGKIDRNALPSPVGLSKGATKSPPETETEVAVGAIWSQVIGTEDISRDDNFFDIGGHSLLAVRVISEVEGRTGFRLTPRMIVMKSLRELAATIDDANGISNDQPPSEPTSIQAAGLTN